jgi:glycosyltransferase involved in cell wall biosynthesis
MTARPLLSIVIPSYNQGRFIRETIESILSQDYRPIEVLIFDGASTDETVEVLKSYGAPELQWWSEPDKGVVDAVNKGLARARGEIVAIQSSDDTYLPGAFTTVVDAFREADAGLIYGDVEYIDTQSRVFDRTRLPSFDLRQYVGKRMFIPQPAAFFTAVAMRAAGAWRDDISYAADAEFYLRIAAKFPVRKVDTLLARYRYHEAQRDKEASRVPRDWANAIDPLTKSPDRAMRRAARSGIWMVRHAYTPEARWARRTYLQYRVVAADPPLLFRRGIAVQELIPFAWPLRRALSRLKQALGFRPRQ